MHIKQSIINEIGLLKLKFIKKIKNIKKLEDFYKIKNDFTNKNNFLSFIYKEIILLKKKDKPIIGKIINKINILINKEIENCFLIVNNKNKKLKNYLDITIPVSKISLGSNHPITAMQDLITKELLALGFNIVIGPEVEHDFYNFDILNIPKDHPSRSKSDTFYIKPDILLRTHTTSIQARILLTMKDIMPIRIISLGKVYRRDDDITHSPMFHQIEGLYIDKKVSFANLKGTLLEFIYRIFERNIKLRWRMSYFPFTEPSCEIDISCFNCNDQNDQECMLCKGTKWIEVMGAGLINPVILQKASINTNIYNGFAFGLGVERFAMIYYGIKNIKSFYDNNIQFKYNF